MTAVDSNTRSNTPPNRSKGVLWDIGFFLLKKPKIPTLIKFNDPKERENYTQRILQRLNTSVRDYTILNIHRIGIDAPVRYVFEELFKWDGDSTCWPNYIARVERIDDRIENIRIYLFGKKRYPPGFKKSFFGFKYIPLFNLRAIRIQHLPNPNDFDNARYFLYQCSGGYPIGIFAIYARSPIPSQNEKEQTQLFFVVGFNFYGEKEWPNTHYIFNRIWEKVHNRVSANILNRFKQLCEWRFQKIQQGFR